VGPVGAGVVGAAFFADEQPAVATSTAATMPPVITARREEAQEASIQRV
jgi:hypothetical protein